jgi:cysteine desulfurase/selenocysteine lyase
VSDASEHLAPHELAALAAQLGDHNDVMRGHPPGPNAITSGSPGLAPAALAPTGFAPTPPVDDVTAILRAIDGAGNPFGVSYVPLVDLSPSSVNAPFGSAPGMASMAGAPSGSSGSSGPRTPASPDFTIPTQFPFAHEPERISLVTEHAPAETPRTTGGEPAAQAPIDSPIRAGTAGAFDPYVVRRDFPILEERVHNGKRLIWLDNGATTQKPRKVIDRISYFYEHENSNVHRAAHVLAARATDAYEGARETTRKFLNAPSTSEIVFVRGATEGINLIANTFGKRHVERGDEIIVTHLEHHANIVPWQMLCREVGATLRVAPVDDRGDVILEAYERLFCSRTKLVAFTQVSNAIGTVTPAAEMIAIAHRWGATVVLDGAQAVSHMPVDVQALDCDFYVFSGHKVFAPTGIGAVFGKLALLEAMPPWQGGGNMIADVTFEKTQYQPPPWKFEAGTGNIADVAGMGAALDYVMRIGMPTIERYEHSLLEYALGQLATVPGLQMIGNPRNRAGVMSFVLAGKRTEDVGHALDKDGIAVRSGHHCAQPILRRFGQEGTVRASLAFYNVCEDIDAMVATLKRIQASV